MCEYCNIVKRMSAEKDLSGAYSLLQALVNKGRLTIYAGDCDFDDWGEVMDSERHFTVSFYLKCSTCGGIYFFGGCIRGATKLYEADSAHLQRIENLIWGGKGEYFEGK